MLSSLPNYINLFLLLSKTDVNKYKVIASRAQSQKKYKGSFNKHAKVSDIKVNNGDPLKNSIARNSREEKDLFLKKKHSEDSNKSKQDISQSSQDIIEKKSHYEPIAEFSDKQDDFAGTKHGIKQKFKGEFLEEEEALELNQQRVSNIMVAQQKEATRNIQEKALNQHGTVPEITADNGEALKDSIARNINEGTDLIFQEKYEEALQHFGQADKEFKVAVEINERFNINIDLNYLRERIEEINSILEDIKSEALKAKYREMITYFDPIITEDILVPQESSKQFFGSAPLLMLGENQYNNQDTLGGING